MMSTSISGSIPESSQPTPCVSLLTGGGWLSDTPVLAYGNPSGRRVFDGRGFQYSPEDEDCDDRS